MLDVYEDYLYVSTYKTHKVLKFSKFYNKTDDDTQYLTNTSRFIGDIVTYQKYKQEVPTGTGAQFLYSKTCVKRPLKNRQNKDLNDKW